MKHREAPQRITLQTGTKKKPRIKKNQTETSNPATKSDVPLTSPATGHLAARADTKTADTKSCRETPQSQKSGSPRQSRGNQRSGYGTARKIAGCRRCRGPHGQADSLLHASDIVHVAESGAASALLSLRRREEWRRSLRRAGAPSVSPYRSRRYLVVGSPKLDMYHHRVYKNMKKMKWKKLERLETRGQRR